MPVCTYDNPNNWRRECWQDGRLVCWYSFEFFFFRDAKIAPEMLFFGANIGPWREGQIVGDERAMKKSPDMPGLDQSPYGSSPAAIAAQARAVRLSIARGASSMPNFLPRSSIW